MPSVTPARAVPTLAIAAYAALLGALLWTAGVPLTHEDGFYYFAIARNLAAGRGSTFDGLHPTNGYHPLWMLVLAGVHRVAPPGRALVYGTLLQAALMAASAALLFLAARRVVRTGPALLAALVFLGLLAPLALSGLELALHATIVVAVAWAWLAGGDSPRRALATGGLLALGVLARLDVALLVVALAGAAVFGRGTRRGTRALALAGPAALALAAYLAANQAWFGHPLPVSAAAKRLWSEALLLRDPHYATGGWLWAKIANAAWMLRHLGSTWVLGLFAGTVGAVALSFAPAARATRRLRPFALAALAQLVAYVLVHHGELTYARWYYALPPMLAALLAADLLEWATERGGQARVAIPVAACTMVVLGTAIGLARWRREESPRRPLLEAAAWARASLPEDARIGAWNAGTLGYLSGRTVVNLDGLVNSWAFLESEQYDLCAYWDRNGITYVIDAFAEDGPSGTPVVVPVVMPAARAYAGCASRLHRVWQDGPEGRPWRVRAYALLPP